MSNPMAMMMLKSLVGPEQLETLEKLVNELMRALMIINEMDMRLKEIQAELNAMRGQRETDDRLEKIE